MLNALLRNFGVSMLVGITACSFGSTPVGQGSSNSSAGQRRDGGVNADAATTTKRRVSTRKTDARVDEGDPTGGEDVDAGQGDTQPAKQDAGSDGRKASGGTSGSGTNTKPATSGDDKKPETGTNQGPNQNQEKPMDAGTTTTMTTTTSPADAGPQRTGDAATDAGDPIGNLEDLAKMSPSARTTATINKFLTTLSEGDAPASSIKEFLNSINDEVNCKMNPLAYECLTACQAVGTTCALCILEEECRMTMLDICGVTALGGCIPRR